MPKADSASVESVAKGLDDTEEVTLQVGDANADSRQSSAGASRAASATSSAGEVAGGTAGGPDDDDEDTVDTSDLAAALDTDNDEDAELTEEELVALEELRDFYRSEAENTIVPKLQSTYDRQIAAINRQLEAANQAAAQREKLLLEQVREAKLVGLTDAEKAQLTSQWDFEDKMRALDEREQLLTDYHTNLLREAYAQEYAEYGLTADDLLEFETPEDMDAFVKEVQLEYYRALAELRANGGTSVDEEEPPKPKAKTKPVPAGAQAPSDAGGGAAVPEVKGFNKGQGINAMYENLKNPDGWERVNIKS